MFLSPRFPLYQCAHHSVSTAKSRALSTSSYPCFFSSPSNMTLSQPTIILVSGAYGLTHIKPAVPPLEKLGYRVIPCPRPLATSAGAQQEDVHAIESAITRELDNKRDVVLVLHSAGGRVGAEAANNILNSRAQQRGSIRRIIFLATFLSDDRNDTASVRLINAGHVRPGTGSEEGFVFVDRAHEISFDDMTPEQYKPFVDALTSTRMYTNPDLEDEGWKRIPHVYLRCTRDKTTLPEFQTGIAERWSMEIVDIEAGQNPFVSRPEQFAGVVDSILTA